MRTLGHDWTETALASEDLRHVLLVAEFGAPEDLVAHFEALEGEGWPGVLDGLARITVADVIGEVDDASRALLGKYDFVHFLSPVPDGWHELPAARPRRTADTACPRSRRPRPAHARMSARSVATRR